MLSWTRSAPFLVELLEMYRYSGHKEVSNTSQVNSVQMAPHCNSKNMVVKMG